MIGIGAGAGGAAEEQLALGPVAGEGGSALELRAGLLRAAELRQQVPADARQEVVAGERRLAGKGVDELEAGGAIAAWSA